MSSRYYVLGRQVRRFNAGALPDRICDAQSDEIAHNIARALNGAQFGRERHLAALTAACCAARDYLATYRPRFPVAEFDPLLAKLDAALGADPK